MLFDRIFKFDPGQPRHPKGSPVGGQFAPKGHFLRDAAGIKAHKVGMRQVDKAWVYEDGKPVGEEVSARLKALRIPPAWTGVRLNADPESNLQAIGVDVKGRKQYRYSTEHSTTASAEKFERLKAFNEAIPNIRRNIAKDILEDGPNREEAEVLYLIDKTGFRIGGEGDTGADVTAYGATTLRDEHVSVSVDDVVRFSFIGKKGVKITKRLKDDRLATILRGRRQKFAGALFHTNDSKVRAYLKSISHESFMVKDFRTWHGTALALKLVAKMKHPKNKTEYNRQRLEVGKKVAEFLGNTHTVALASYISPEVFKDWSTE